MAMEYILTKGECYLERCSKNHYEVYHILKDSDDLKDVEYESHLVTNDEIGSKRYKLSVSSYVRKEEVREDIDIVALNQEIDEIVKREESLRVEIAKIIESIR